MPCKEGMDQDDIARHKDGGKNPPPSHQAARCPFPMASHKVLHRNVVSNINLTADLSFFRKSTCIESPLMTSVAHADIQDNANCHPDSSRQKDRLKWVPEPTS